MTPPPEPTAKVTLTKVYEELGEVKETLVQLVDVHRRLDEHRKELHSHSGRLRRVEVKMAAHNVIVVLATSALGVWLGRALFAG